MSEICEGCGPFSRKEVENALFPHQLKGYNKIEKYLERSGLHTYSLEGALSLLNSGVKLKKNSKELPYISKVTGKIEKRKLFLDVLVSNYEGIINKKDTFDALNKDYSSIIVSFKEYEKKSDSKSWFSRFFS